MKRVTLKAVEDRIRQINQKIAETSEPRPEFIGSIYDARSGIRVGFRDPDMSDRTIRTWQYRGDLRGAWAWLLGVEYVVDALREAEGEGGNGQ